MTKTINMEKQASTFLFNVETNVHLVFESITHPIRVNVPGGKKNNKQITDLLPQSPPNDKNQTFYTNGDWSHQRLQQKDTSKPKPDWQPLPSYGLCWRSRGTLCHKNLLSILWCHDGSRENCHRLPLNVSARCHHCNALHVNAHIRGMKKNPRYISTMFDFLRTYLTALRFPTDKMEPMELILLVEQWC